MSAPTPQAFLSHSATDKDVVEPIATWLEQHDVKVWLDAWELTPGDSLVGRIGEGIQSSDRLVVFLSEASVASNWVQKEVATGLVMEIGKQKGNDYFVVPAVLTKCDIPVMLLDKLYANFTDKPFEAACQELLRGILKQPTGSQVKTIQNGSITVYDAPPTATDKFAKVLQFAVRVSPTNGVHIGVKCKQNINHVFEWFGPKDQPQMPVTVGNHFVQSMTKKLPTSYARKFRSPNITSGQSFYVYIGGSSELEIEDAYFFDFFDQSP